uniref:Ig-like domain-containing protein n=1 Tax=Maylandia zebra TaxID=106582 RepID=A0A3P9CAZ9_9CICH
FMCRPFLICILYLFKSATCQKEVKVRQGENAILECYGPSDATEIMLRWTKPDLQTDNYVIYLKDGHFQKDLQNDLFKGRVELKDSKWMTNGNFSVILQNVTLNDSGTYECYAAYNNQPVQILNSTSLKVEEQGDCFLVVDVCF